MITNSRILFCLIVCVSLTLFAENPKVVKGDKIIVTQSDFYTNEVEPGEYTVKKVDARTKEVFIHDGTSLVAVDHYVKQVPSLTSPAGNEIGSDSYIIKTGKSTNNSPSKNAVRGFGADGGILYESIDFSDGKRALGYSKDYILAVPGWTDKNGNMVRPGDVVKMKNGQNNIVEAVGENGQILVLENFFGSGETVLRDYFLRPPESYAIAENNVKTTRQEYGYISNGKETFLFDSVTGASRKIFTVIKSTKFRKNVAWQSPEVWHEVDLQTKIDEIQGRKTDPKQMGKLTVGNITYYYLKENKDGYWVDRVSTASGKPKWLPSQSWQNEQLQAMLKSSPKEQGKVVRSIKCHNYFERIGISTPSPQLTVRY